jgi:hypothetical protein
MELKKIGIEEGSFNLNIGGLLLNSLRVTANSSLSFGDYGVDTSRKLPFLNLY